jgi:sigma-70-like protein
VHTIEETLAAVVPSVRRTALKYAHRMYGYGEYGDDFYSEGMVAAWKALEKNPEAPEGWLVGAAEFRIRGLAYSIVHPGTEGRKVWLGKPRSQTYPGDNPGEYSLDNLSEWYGDEMYAGAYEDPDVSLAYHRAELRGAISSLSEPQRLAIAQRACGVPVEQSATLRLARANLREMLSHLADAA